MKPTLQRIPDRSQSGQILRRVGFIARIADWARHAGTAAIAGPIAIPWRVLVVLTHPKAIIAECAFHKFTTSEIRIVLVSCVSLIRIRYQLLRQPESPQFDHGKMR
jgi:hypothetical protein